jgi:uncharacterized membrane-anchored protein
VRTKLLILIAALQVLVLAYMAGEREWVLRTSRTIYLRSAPIDPRDAMRGDYVRVNYPMSSVPAALCQGRLVTTNATFEGLRRDTRVYAALRTDTESVAELLSLSSERPPGGVFIRGRTERSWGDHVQVRYGLEALFLEQGRGHELEQPVNRDDIWVPLEMKVAVSPGGLAVLDGYRRCGLGMGFQVDIKEEAGAGGQRRRRAVGATVRLFNASSNKLAVVDLPNAGSLALVPVPASGATRWHWAQEAQAAPAPQASNIIVLRPGEMHSLDVHFSDPQWSVISDSTGRKSAGSPVRLTDLKGDWSERFRLEYRPPDRAACAGLPNADLIWHGRLTSRAFNPLGNVD